MSPDTGAKDGGHDDTATMLAEIDRLSSLSLHQLAAEVMQRGFGPGGPGAPGEPGTLESPMTRPVPRNTVGHIAAEFTPAYRSRLVSPDLQLRLAHLVSEGIQLLEHCCLIRPEVHANRGALSYAATRLGRAAVERGEVELILDGGAL